MEDLPWTLNSLPEDVLIHLFLLLPKEDLGSNVALVSHKFRELTDCEEIWKHRCASIKGLTFKQRSKSWKETFLSDIQDTCTHLGQVSRRDIEELWIFLQSLYNKGEDLKDGCGLPSKTLWVCLKCPHFGCGRRYGAHALKHYEETGHMLSVKLLTLEFSCYICEQWLGEDGRPEIEIERVQEIYGWLQSSSPASIKHLYMNMDTKKKRMTERRIRWAEDDDPSWSVFPLKWYEGWLDFVVGDSEQPTTPIDNSVFINEDGSLRRPLTIDKIVILSNDQWEHLSATYGGGPHIIWHNVHRKWIINPTREELK